MRLTSCAGVLVAILAGIGVAWAKGATTRIVVTGPHLTAPIDFRDRGVLAPFNVWSGPGTYMNGVEGMNGFIVDWHAGAMAQPSAGLERFEIAFYAERGPAGSDDVVYVVSYAVDDSGGADYVYLPGRGDSRWGRNVRSIHRGEKYEGHWFRASAAWQKVMRTHVLLRR